MAILWLYRQRYMLFSLAFVGAVFAHAEAALLLPGFALGLLLLEGWLVLRRFQVWLAFGISGLAVLVRFFIHRLISMGGGQFQPIDSRPAFQLTLRCDQFVSGERWRAVVLLIAGCIVLFGTLRCQQVLEQHADGW